MAYDVVVVGSGPGGAATAHYLASAGVSVLLLDKFEFPRDKTCGDGLTPRGLALLDEMGILGRLQREGYLINGLEVFSPNGASTTVGIPRSVGAPDYALCVPRLTLDNVIRVRALACGAKFEGRVRVLDIERGAHGVVVRGEHHGRAVSAEAEMAVLATGASTSLLLQIGILRRPPPVLLATRTYFEGVTGLADRFQLHFDGVPLPGYGWVFPLSDRSANIGAGFFPVGRMTHRLPTTSRTAFDAFIQAGSLRGMLNQARCTSLIKGYPLRADFLTAPTIGERVLLVGEAAGLVNPLTGEGIDYALESGKMAAEHIIRMFATGDLSQPNFEAYDRLLRQRFQRLFFFCTRMRDWFINPPALNRLIFLSNQDAGLKMQLINIVLGNQKPSRIILLNAILKMALSLCSRRQNPVR